MCERPQKTTNPRIRGRMHSADIYMVSPECLLCLCRPWLSNASSESDPSQKLLFSQILLTAGLMSETLLMLHSPRFTAWRTLYGSEEERAHGLGITGAGCGASLSQVGHPLPLGSTYSNMKDVYGVDEQKTYEHSNQSLVRDKSDKNSPQSLLRRSIVFSHHGDLLELSLLDT